jgi:serine/threonine protein phosphatase 1
MTYVISDIHGNFDKFKEMLELIRFGERDVMYVLGDIVDYGDKPIELLLDLSMRYNVLPILGEHDMRAYKLLSALDEMLRDGNMPDADILGEMTEWITDGGQKTMEGFKALDDEMREGVLDYLSDMALYEEVEVKGKKYLLVHAGIADFDEDLDLDDCMPEDFISEALDFDREYFEDTTLIVGHVPTSNIEGAQAGKIYRSDKNSIAIDCGAAFGEALGCLCLENGKEFYV